MPRKHRTARKTPPAPVAVATPQPAPAVVLDEEDWGYAPPSVADLPPLPPPPARATEEAAAPPPTLIALGAPPASPRLSHPWGYRLLMLQAHEAAIDPGISSTTRRKEVRVILAAAAKLYPDAARAEVADIIEQDRRELETRKRAKAAAKLEARPPAGDAKVIPIRRDA